VERGGVKTWNGDKINSIYDVYEFSVVNIRAALELCYIFLIAICTKAISFWLK